MMQTELPTVLQGALVAAVDDSPPAREALRYAAQMAADAGRPLHVLTVWNFVTGAPPAQDQDAPPTAEAWQAEAERRLEALLDEELPDRRDVVGSVVVLHGNTVPVLLEVTKRVDHLVVGSRGRGGFRGLLLGSTSEQLVRHADCPVTVVRQGCTTS